jgi:hypothetical protein
LFDSGSDGERIFAIGLVQGKPELANRKLLADTIAHSRSAFEQYHGLRATEAAWGLLARDDRAELLLGIDRQVALQKELQTDTDRATVIARIRKRGLGS